MFTVIIIHQCIYLFFKRCVLLIATNLFKFWLLPSNMLCSQWVTTPDAHACVEIRVATYPHAEALQPCIDAFFPALPPPEFLRRLSTPGTSRHSFFSTYTFCCATSYSALLHSVVLSLYISLLVLVFLHHLAAVFFCLIQSTVPSFFRYNVISLFIISFFVLCDFMCID